MTATDTIRAMLDERGVEWTERVWGGKHSVTTFWHARGVRWHYRENRFGEVRLHADGLTPEQAIEATLGRGECRNKAIRPLTFWCDQCDCATEGWVDVGGMLINGFRYCPNCGRKVKA